jgi:AcrR family transcriptional regulator
VSATRGRPARIDKAEVVLAAGELFLRQGYAATTMDQVAQAAGISRKSLFLYFPSKGDLIWHRAAPYVESLRLDLERYSGNPDDLGEAVIAAVAAGYRNAPDRDKTMPALIHLYVADVSVRDLVERHGAPWRAIVSDAAERAGASALVADVIGYGFWRAMWLGMEEWEVAGGSLEDKVLESLSAFSALVPGFLGA